jgi:hypothetical protein
MPTAIIRFVRLPPNSTPITTDTGPMGSDA